MRKLLRQFKMTMFFKYLLSYMIVFFVPFALLLGVVDINFMKTYKEEVTQNNNSNLDKMKTALDTQLKQLNTLAYQMEIDSEFAPINLKDDYKRLSAYKKIGVHNNINDFITEMIFYDRETQTYVSSTGIHAESYVKNNLSRYSDWTALEWKSNFEELTTPRYMPFELIRVNGEEKRMLSYLYPFRYWSGSPDGTILFQIDEKSFAAALAAPTDLDQTGLFIYDWDGTLLYESNSSIAITDEIAQLAIQSDHSSSVRSFEYEQYIVTTTQSLDTGWTYVQLTSLHTSMQKVTALREQIVLLGLIVLVVGSILVYVSMKINYHPIRQLRSFIQSSVGPIPTSSNMLDSARYAINNLQQANVVLKDRVSKTSDSVKRDLLLKLIKGHFTDTEQFQRTLREYEISIDHPLMCTSVIRLEGSNLPVSSDIDSLIQQLELIEHANIHCYGLNSIANDRLILVLLFDHESSSTIAHYLEQMRQHIKESIGLNCVVGVGSVCTEMSDMYRSFLEANLLVNYKSSQSKDSVSFYHEAHHAKQDYPKEEIEQMQTALKDYHIERFDQVLDYLMNFASNSRTSMFLSICLCYDIINSILKAMHEINPQFSEQHPYHQFLEVNNAYHTVSDLVSSIHNLSQDVRTFMQSSGYHSDKGVIDQMKNYMQIHYTSPLFSMQALADQFQMSTSNISHYFKSHTGKTPSQFFNELRVGQAKQLLKTTDKSLDEISRDIGYSNASSFIRMFKQHFDCTPGEYRKLHKQKPPHS